MFLLPRRQIWTQQPQGAVDIDWSNPLTRGLTYATADGAGGADSSITSLGSVPKIADRWGKGDYFNGSSQKIAKNSLVGRSLDLTVCVLHKSTVLPPNGPTYSHVLASTTGASSADYYGWILMLGNVTGAPQFRVYQSAFGGQDADCDATGAINDGKPHLTIATAYGGPGGAMSLDVDGKTVASSTHPSGIYSRTNNLAIGKARHDFWGGFEGSIGAVFVFDRVLSAKERSSLSANPWQIFKRPDSRIFVPVSAGGGSVNANASGALSAVAVTAPSASASGGASASGALATITIYSPTATASAGGSANASGSFAAISISPATATATATKSATASGAFAVVSLSAPTATASGTTAGGAVATGAPAQITISHATAIALGSAVASGGYQSIGITAPTGSASVGSGNATASGAWAAISITAPTAYASNGFIRAPSGSGPTAIQPGSYRPSNTGGRRY
jgi:hypothetical protein